MDKSGSSFGWLLGAALALFGCKGASVDLPGAPPSPQAKAEPAPLANPPAPTAPNLAYETGMPPEPLRSDEGLAADATREAPREPGSRDPGRDAKEFVGYALQVVVRTGEGPSAPKAAEVNAPAIDAARRKAEPHIALEVSPTRARFVLSGGFATPQGTELRARIDRYGHVILWPDEDVYRVAEPGALRALLGERRLDVAPLSPAYIGPSDEGARRLNVRTRRVDVTTRAARATLELATLRDVGDGGALVCRFLLDLMDAAPSTAACATDEIPFHAELRWTTQGALTFDVTSIARRTDLPASDLAVPPASLEFVATPPPPLLADTVLPRGELAAFRTAAVDVPPAAAHDAQAAVPEAGLTLVNSSDELRVAWIDGVPVAWVAPRGRLSLPSLIRGRYALQWRTFLGDGWDPPETIVAPGVSEVGANR